jgi:hypothetical protein
MKKAAIGYSLMEGHTFEIEILSLLLARMALLALLQPQSM